MFEFKRYRPLLQVGTALLIGLLLLDVILLGLLGWSPSPLWPQDKPMGAFWLDRAASRAIGAQRELDAQAGGHPGLAIVVGLSTVREGLDSALLDSADADTRRWLIIGGSGSSMAHLEQLLRPLADLSIQADALVAGIHLPWFIGCPQQLPDRSRQIARLREAVHDLSPARVTGLLLDLGWLAHNHQRANLAVQRTLKRARLQTLGMLGLPRHALHPPATNPWASEARYPPEPPPREFLDRQLTTWEQCGWFDPSSYRPDRSQVRIFRQLAKYFGEADIPLVVVLMPEQAELRKRIPQQKARALLDAALAPLRGQRSVILLDLRDSIPDALFRDLAHLNPQGRRRFSQQLGRRLHNALKAP